ncbi:LysE family translocator [Pseudomonas capsici]|uniref:LysE family translocator n=1 Tax=Pseudomonas capsici TaxID=2810614 RepID=UPI000E3C14BE|nr:MULTISPECIES: LysE family transporter [Pseudomonas]MCV4283631.1 LysE family translocator [Pseudomonas capsici]MCV4340515.1 LysE family translocator [Pseudomonas capsici]GFM52755.1 membrane protein [Pseudomonas cichorii]GFM63021.1 membrane protein [Pseudomonas cichorii]
MEFYNGFLLSLSLCLEIGLANMAMITLSMQRGFRQGVWLGVGTCIGDLVYAILALAGMAVLLQYEAVRWALWLGGSAILAYLCFKMVASAMRVKAGVSGSEMQWGKTNFALFSKGIFLAMSSPSAILWFAAVGGAIIAKQGVDLNSSILFLSGFFSAGIFWALVLCTLAYHGGQLLGEKMLRWTYIASALIFAYFTLYVVISGYMEFVSAQPVIEH